MKGNLLALVSVAASLIAIGLARPSGAQTYNWTGLYVGAQAGFAKPKDVVTYGGSSTGAPFDSLNQVIKNRENGFAGGMQAGYNQQFGWIVPGLEADLGYMGFNGDQLSPTEFDPQQQTHAISSGGLFGTVTARFGIAIDRALLYTKGGFAYANLRLGVTDNIPPLTTDATKRLTYRGWTIGGGIEYALSQNWLIKSEYQFMDFGERAITTVSSDGITDTWKHAPSAHILKLGINYKF
jgi:outer membrane immunogenic protein